MITEQLINPKSIVVVGGSDDINKPGGAIIKNLKNTNFGGEIYVVNLKADQVQDLKSYRKIEDIPQVDCAILAISAKFCLSTVEVLCKQKSCRAIIIISAGFHEEDRKSVV